MGWHSSSPLLVSISFNLIGVCWMWMRWASLLMLLFLNINYANGAEPTGASFREFVKGNWKAVRIGDQAITGYHPTLSLTPKLERPFIGEIDKEDADFLVGAMRGGLAGTSSCNFYTAAYAVKGPQLRVLQLASTLKICYPLSRMDQEKLFNREITRITHWSLDNGKLVLSSARSGKTIIFVPLEN